MENYQEADGSIRIPDALLPYMGGLTKIEAAKQCSRTFTADSLTGWPD